MENKNEMLKIIERRKNVYHAFGSNFCYFICCFNNRGFAFCQAIGQNSRPYYIRADKQGMVKVS